MPSDGDAGFIRLIAALGPWLDQVVIVGGWAHRLFHFHPAAQALDFRPLMTLDVDVALPENLPSGAQTIREALVSSGFREEFLGKDVPPATHYCLGDAVGGFYAEFLTPLTGSEYTRSGKRKATVHIAGVNSQRLRYIDLLLHDPWTVQIGPERFDSATPTTLRIANPVTFLAQKLLIHDKRSAEDQAKDILYIHDTLQVFGSRLDELRDEWRSRVRYRLNARAAKGIASSVEYHFSNTTDTIREAARMATDRRLSPDSLRQSCEYGLLRVMG